jgi:GT2 family glycosyltransferase
VLLIRKEFPMVNLIEHPVNSGFSGGNLVGLKMAKGEYIALLNSDAFPEPDWLLHAVKGMTLSPKIGICASKLLVNGSDLIDSAGDGCTTASKGFKRGEMKPAHRYHQMQYVFGACGGAVLYRRAMIDEIGFLDEDFFLIHEDTDLNFRAQLAGWKCLYVPEATVHHQVRSTIGAHSDLAIYYSNRNADLVWIKNTPFWLMLRYLHHKILSDLGSLVFFGIRKRRLGVFLKSKSKFDVLRLLPRMLKKRRQIQRMKKLSNREIAGLLTSFWEKGYLGERWRRLMKG